MRDELTTRERLGVWIVSTVFILLASRIGWIAADTYRLMELGGFRLGCS